MTAIVETFNFVGPKVPSIPKAAGNGSYLDYTFNWTNWLALDADSIASAVVTVSGVELVVQVDSWPRVRAKVRGGVAGTWASITCTITTSQGRSEPRTMHLQIKER